MSVYPLHYKIHLEPDLETFTFQGTAEIQIKAENKAREVSLNAGDLALWSCKVKRDSGDYVDCAFALDPEAQEVRIDLPDAMNEITVKIDYVGKSMTRWSAFTGVDTNTRVKKSTWQ